MKPEPSNVLVMERDLKQVIIRFIDRDSATFACRMLRRQPNIIFAQVVRRYEEAPAVDYTTDCYVRDLLALL